MARLKGGAVIEIRTAAGPPAVWTAITCQVVEARTATGASKSRGILTQSEPGQIELTLYDPARLLDPNNPSSPYKAVLKAGLPIRFSHDDGTRTLIKEGFVDSLEHDVTTHGGFIRANDWLAWAANYQYPNATVGGAPLSQSDNFYEYMTSMVGKVNAVDPAGLVKVPFTIHTETGVIWIIQEPVGNAGSPGQPMLDYMTGFGEGYLYMVWLQGSVIRAVDAMAAHGPRVTVGCGGHFLTGFETRTDATGIVNVVRSEYPDSNVYTANRPSSVTRWGEKVFEPGAPVPLRGRFNAGGGASDFALWSTPVLDDRAEPALEAVPMRILPQTATELRALLAITPMQQVRIYGTNPALDIYARAVGAEVGVTPEGWEVKLVTYIRPGDPPLAFDDALVFEAVE